MNLYASTDQAVLNMVAAKVKSNRIAMQLTQRQLAVNAGVSLSSVQSLERGGNCSLMTLVQILRAAHGLDLLEPFAREEEISPIAYAEALKKSAPKQRVRNKKPVTPKYVSEW